MKKIALSVLFGLLKKYAPEAIAWIITRILQYSINKHGSGNYDKVITEAEEMTAALTMLVKVSSDGKLSKEEVEAFKPILIEAIKIG